MVIRHDLATRLAGRISSVRNVVAAHVRVGTLVRSPHRFSVRLVYELLEADGVIRPHSFDLGSEARPAELVADAPDIQFADPRTVRYGFATNLAIELTALTLEAARQSGNLIEAPLPAGSPREALIDAAADGAALDLATLARLERRVAPRLASRSGSAPHSAATLARAARLVSDPRILLITRLSAARRVAEYLRRAGARSSEDVTEIYVAPTGNNSTVVAYTFRTATGGNYSAAPFQTEEVQRVTSLHASQQAYSAELGYAVGRLLDDPNADLVSAEEVRPD